MNYLGIDIKEESVKKIVRIFNTFEIRKEEKFEFSSQSNFMKLEQLYYSLKRIFYGIYMLITFTKKIQRNDLGKYEKIYGGITKKEVKFYLKKLNKKNINVENVINDVVMIEQS